MNSINQCKSCGFRVRESGKCRLIGIVKEPENFCDRHNFNPPICSRCGAYTLNPIIDNNKYYCHKCADAILGCAGCANAQNCEFEQNPSPTPKLVQQQIRQGNMISVQTVKNPKRIEEFCHKCSCWNTNFNWCGREFDWCSNYDNEEKKELNDSNTP